MFIINELYEKKSNDLKRPLKHKKQYPQNISKITKDPASFQGFRVDTISTFALPIKIERGNKILLDFGDHCVGYLSFSLNHYGNIRITDSPVKLKFSFGEFPLEIATPPEDYNGTLGNGWIQQEERQIVFTPYTGTLERRYAFRYVLIERIDNAPFPIDITDIFADCVSSVNIETVFPIDIEDTLLKDIYNISVKTLKECEQDVFEDGPKRDRRLWIGDLRLQALTDYKTFRNYDLIKRCIYLFAAYRANHRMVASCIFPDSPPYVDEWCFADYSLFFISCLYDYLENTGDINLVGELYDIAYEQVKIVSSKFNDKKGIIELSSHIDWCPSLDKDISLLGVYIYTLRQIKTLAEKLNKDFEWIILEIDKASRAILKFYSKNDNLFISPSGQISWHSQVWAVLSEVLSKKENILILEKMQNINTVFTMRTPYMIHYYLEALYNCGLEKSAIEVIKNYWGKIIESGFDCCPEVFNPDNEFESPYEAPEINSACHAWSCTPAYWIHKYYNKN